MKIRLFMVLLIVLSVSLFAAPVSLEPAKDYETILFSSQEEVVSSDLYTTVHYEILAVESVNHKQRIISSIKSMTVTGKLFRNNTDTINYSNRFGFNNLKRGGILLIASGH